MIETLTESQLCSIKEYFKNNNIVDYPEQSISISNCDLYDCIENYKTINSVENDCIIQFASNAGGRTSYHYLKKEKSFTSISQTLLKKKFLNKNLIFLVKKLKKNIKLFLYSKRMIYKL